MVLTYLDECSPVNENTLKNFMSEINTKFIMEESKKSYNQVKLMEEMLKENE